MASYEEQIDTLIAYVEDGLPPGSYTRAMLENNLMETMGRADATSLYSLHQVCSFIYNRMPKVSWGSPERVEAWIKQGGLQGRKGEEEK